MLKRIQSFVKNLISTFKNHDFSDQKMYSNECEKYSTTDNREINKYTNIYDKENNKKDNNCDLWHGDYSNAYTNDYWVGGKSYKDVNKK